VLIHVGSWPGIFFFLILELILVLLNLIEFKAQIINDGILSFNLFRQCTNLLAIVLFLLLHDDLFLIMNFH